MQNALIQCLFLASALAYASTFEWTLHRFLMHRPVGRFDYPFRAHTLTHHKVFRYDQTYFMINDADKHTIPMAWWNGPLLIIISSSPAVLVSSMTGKWSLTIVFVSVIASYYGLYEYIHWCMHLPKARRRLIERLWFFPFRKLNGHHLLHHRYMGKNFNVVLPLADWIFGTLLLRAPVKFLQARGHSVPDVQPIHSG